MGFRLDSLEKRLRSLVEDHLGSVPWRGREARWARMLLETLQSALLEQPTGQPVPEVCIIETAPSIHTLWQAHPEWQVSLSRALQETLLEAGFIISNPPHLILRANPTLSGEDVRVSWNTSEEPMAQTATFTPVHPAGEDKAQTKTPRAYLIIEGEEIFPLTEAVTNIGRRPDNHLVLTDMRVSRQHAQIRRSAGHYMIFDLNSTGGTYVNGERITRRILRPGDVISLAGVTLIYGEEVGHDAAGETRPVEVP